MIKYPNLSESLEQIGKDLVNCSFKVHKAIGPGMLERVYEVCIEHELNKLGYDVKRQVEIPIEYDGIRFDEGFRADLVIENSVIVEIKAVDKMHPVYTAQIISYLKMMNKKLGYLINFHEPLIKNGIERIRV